MIVAASPFDTVFGLPVHSLVVHAVVVLLPLAAVGAIAMALRPSWSRTYGPIVILGAIAGTAAAVVAQESGEQLAGRVGWQIVEQHMQLGGLVKWVGLGLVVVTALLWWRDRAGAAAGRNRPASGRSTSGRVLAALVVVAAIAATVQTVRAGHSGSEAVWKDIIDNTKPDQQPRPAG